MKKILTTLLFTIMLSLFASVKADTLSNEDIIDNAEKKLNDTQQLEENFEQPIILEPEETAPETKEDVVESPYSKKALKGILTKEYDLNSADGMFKDQLTINYKRGPLKTTTFQLSQIHLLSETIQSSDSDLKFDPNTINIGIKGAFRSGKEKYNILLNTPANLHQNFMHRFVLDAWIETKRIPHHTVTFGTFRPCVGYEGAQGAFVIPLIYRSQIARNFGNARKTGLKIKGDYKYVDYEIGGYSADTWYTEFFPGVETDMWINFKPLAHFDKEKVGELKIGGGFQAGKRHSMDYNVSQLGLKYNYKKFSLTSEFAFANGSYGNTGLTETTRWGYNITATYMITKKLQALVRYDDFDNDRKIRHNNTREYTLGFNYFILGQTLRIMLNYIYCQNDSAQDSHKIVLGTQILL